MALKLVPIGEGSKNAGKYLATFQYGKDGKYTGFIFNVTEFKSVFESFTQSTTFKTKVPIKCFDFALFRQAFYDLFGFGVVATPVEGGGFRFGYTSKFEREEETGRITPLKDARVIYFDTLAADCMVKRDVGLLQAICIPIFKDAKNYEKLVENKAVIDNETKQRKWIDLVHGEIGIGEEGKPASALYYTCHYEYIRDTQDPRYRRPWGEYQDIVNDWSSKHSDRPAPKVLQETPQYVEPDLEGDPDLVDERVEEEIVNPPANDEL